jgi:chromosome segregation protein
MTRINRLVCQGFKSFGKRVELVFGDGFNCILGPNGSGKSNVIDAVCFVLGKSSSKSMRAEKAANLIYNGGKAKQPAKHGEVSIFFDNANRTFPTDDKEIKITRIVKKDGGSVYKINDQARTRTQVLDLLAMSKIDPDGYNIILQGDIVRLVEMSPLDRRLIIEEIAGISIYEEKKNKALLELDKVDQRLQEAEIILKERSTYLKELKSDRDHALKFKGLNDKIRSNKASFLKLQMNKKETEIAEIEARIVKHKTEVEKYRNAIAQFRLEIEEKKKEIEKLTKEIEVKGEKDQIAFQKELETARIDLATSKTKIASHGQEIIRVRDRVAQLERNKTDLSKKIADMNSEKDAYIKQKANLDTEVAGYEEKISTFKKKHHLEEETAALDGEIENIDKENEIKQNAINKLREEQRNCCAREIVANWKSE